MAANLLEHLKQTAPVGINPGRKYKVQYVTPTCHLYCTVLCGALPTFTVHVTL